MPITCTSGLVSSVINECANLFTVGRCAPGSVLAVVLHEYDGPLSQLDAHHQQATVESERMCHTSFHFGVGANGTVHQYVEIDDTAWTFPQDWSTDPECGAGNWLVSQGNPGIDPNCYTINIAITTGQVGVGSRTEPRSDNKYDANQINAVIDLLCCLVSNNGVEINIDTNSVWRHLDELEDFPGCRVQTTSGDVANFGDVLTCIQNCIDIQGTGIPSKAQYLCDIIECLTPAGDSPQQGATDFDWVEAGNNEDGNLVSGTNIGVAVNNLPFGKQFISGFNGATVCVDPQNINNQVTITLDQAQDNFVLGIGSLGDIAADRLSGFNVLPDSVTGDLAINAGIVTGTGQGIGTIVWNSLPAGTTLTFIYDTTNPPTTRECFTLMSVQSNTIFNEIGVPAIPGVTELIGADCRTYTIPDMAEGGDVTCDILAGLPSGGFVTANTPLVGNNCETFTINICELITALPTGTVPTQLFGLDDQDNCVRFPVAECDEGISQSAIVSTPTGLEQRRVVSTIPCGEVEEADYTVDMSVDGGALIKIDAADDDRTVMLTPPGACESNHLWIKRWDTSTNTVTVNGGAHLIDGVQTIQLDPACPFGGIRGEASHLVFCDGEWTVV